MPSRLLNREEVVSEAAKLLTAESCQEPSQGTSHHLSQVSEFDFQISSCTRPHTFKINVVHVRQGNSVCRQRRRLIRCCLRLCWFLALGVLLLDLLRRFLVVIVFGVVIMFRVAIGFGFRACSFLGIDHGVFVVLRKGFAAVGAGARSLLRRPRNRGCATSGQRPALAGR
jgi:hypothetical protein